MAAFMVPCRASLRVVTSAAQNEGMKELNFDQLNPRLQALAADLAELERHAAEQRIRVVIEDAKRRKLTPGRTLKPYQVESALRRIGHGESVLSVVSGLRCSIGMLYRALAG
jgi:DNA invertase Pin-like site-specific DNA recombinase